MTLYPFKIARGRPLVVTPVVPVPAVGPGAGWNGTALSGGVPAVFPGGNVTADPITRTTAKPAVCWVVPSGRCLSPSGDIIVGVDADAGGAKAFLSATISGTALSIADFKCLVSTPTVTAAGSGGADGPILLTGTTGTGAKFILAAHITGGSISSIDGINTPGKYTVLPGSLGAEPVTGGGLVGATVNLTGHTGQLLTGTVSVGQTVTGLTGTAYGKVLSGSGLSWVLDTSSTVASPTSMICQQPSGIKRIDFWVEGTTQAVTTPQFLTWTENGVSKTAWGYFIKLRQSDFAAHLTGSEVRLFATAVANDPTMQNRIIGYDLVNNGVYDGNWPLSVFPRAVLNDKSYTVNAANNDVSPNFTTIKKALTQAAADTAEFPLVTFTATASYELENLTNFAAGHGFCAMTCAGGVTASLGRSAAFTPNNPASWTWTPGWDAFEFRGAGIVFQQRNWTQIVNTRPCWFNGCRWTNSIGTRDTHYWNNSGPGYVGGSGPGWLDATYSEFTSGMYLGQFYALNVQAKQTGGSIFTNVHQTQNTFVNDFSNDFYLDGSNRISITYTNPGGHTTATVSRAAGANYVAAPPQNLLLKVDGSTVATIALGFYSTDTNPTVTDVVAAINTFGSGWSASVLNSGGVWPAATIGFNGNDWQFTGNAFNTAFTTNATPDPHGEWWQGFTGGLTRQNVILRNDIVLNNTSAPFINNDADVEWDTIIKGQVWLGTGNSPFYVGGQHNSHYVIENITTNQEWARREYVNGDPAGSYEPGDQTYTTIANNVLGFIAVFGYNGSGTYSPYSPPINNTFYAFGNCTMNGANDTGDVDYSGSAFSTLFVNSGIYDLRPVLAGLLLANQCALLNTYDGRRLTFSNPDIAGAWSQGDPQYSPPF